MPKEAFHVELVHSFINTLIIYVSRSFSDKVILTEETISLCFSSNSERNYLILSNVGNDDRYI
jgi:hypothetical protein